MLALIQKGTGRGLVVFWGPTGSATRAPGLPAGCLAALGPKVTIVGAPAEGAETWQDVVAFAQKKTGLVALWLCALIGFSAGCRNVRTARWAGAPAFAFVLCDGMHSALPAGPERERDLSYARQLVADARAGLVAVVVTHSYIVTEAGGVGGAVPYLSTRAVAELATGWQLLPEPPHGVPRIRRDPVAWQPGRQPWEGHLAVWSVGGHEAPDHRAQANVILHQALEADLVDLVALDDAPAAAPPARPAEPPLGAPSPSVQPAQPTRSSSLALALVGDSLAQGLAAGLRARAAGRGFTSWGVQSSTVSDWLGGGRGTQLAAALAGGPGLVLVSLGTNDMRAGASAAPTAELVQRIQQAGAQALWIAPPSMPWEPMAPAVSPWRSQLAQVLERAGARQPFDSTALQIPRAADRIHPTPTGYAAWADAIGSWVPLGVDREPALELPASIYVAGSGWVSVEDTYLPRVVTAENGTALPEALRAQAVAARTYLLFNVRGGGYGTPQKPVPSSQLFQVMGRTASAAAVRACADTRGEVATWRGACITGNYVAGSRWDDFMSPAADGARTEHFVTYNWKKSGADVRPSPLAGPIPANRGCMSQNGAAWCARFLRAPPFDYVGILRVFYGADLVVGSSSTPPPRPSRPKAPSKPGGVPVFFLAGLALRLLDSSRS